MGTRGSGQPMSCASTGKARSSSPLPSSWNEEKARGSAATGLGFDICLQIKALSEGLEHLREHVVLRAEVRAEVA